MTPDNRNEPAKESEEQRAKQLQQEADSARKALKRIFFVIALLVVLAYLIYDGMQTWERIETLRAQSNEVAASSVLRRYFFSRGGALFGAFLGYMTWLMLSGSNKKRVS